MSNFVRGMQTGLYVSEPAPYGQRASRSSIGLRVRAYTPAGSPTIAVRRNAGTPVHVPAGSILRFATLSVMVTQGGTLTTGADTTLHVQALDGAPGTPISLEFGSWLYFDGMLRVTGTSDSELSISESPADATSVVYEGAMASAVWSETTITSKGWTLPRRGRFRPNDPAYQAVRTAALQGREVFVERVLPDENGEPAEITAGRALITGFATPAPAGGIVDANWVFRGQGPPNTERAELDLSNVMLDFRDPRNAINLTFV